MASCTTKRWVPTAPYVKLTVTQSSSTATTATLSWTLEYYSQSAARTTVDKDYTVKIAGSTVKSSSYDINGKTGWNTVASGTKTINKTTSSQSIAFSVSFGFALNWSGSWQNIMTANGSISVAAKTSYTIKYNANGGSGAPSSQTKWHGTALTLSSTKPTRTGYTFKGWATSSSATSATYVAGASYTANAAVTLYAVWTALTYAVKYNANGGSGAPANQTKTYGKALTLSSTKPTKTNYTFKGWGTSSSATTVAYAAGASYTKDAAITLYAIWTLSYKKPRITSFSVARCTSGGTASDEGTYARVKFSWATDKTVSSVKIEWKPSSSSTWTSSSVTASGTSGTVNQVVGAAAFSTEKTYDIRVTVTDASGGTSSTKKLSGMKFIIDCKSGGTGIAFGKPAELNNYMDVGFKSRIRDIMIFENNCVIAGKATDDTTLQMLGVNANNNLVLGYGSYSEGIGATNIYGDTINLTSNNGTFVGGCRLAVNKVLWSGSYYMSASQSCTLSEAISKQANGIVLMWSEYTDGEAVNANFNFTFVPKRFVSSHAGKGVTSICSSATMNVVAAKYVYISDTVITGYANNSAAAATATCGILTSPKKYVLRYVLGV